MKKAGKVAVWGQRSLGEEWRVYLISVEDGSLEQPEVVDSCDDWPDFECLQIEGQEYLAKSCVACGEIKLINFITMEVTTAFTKQKVSMKREGENNKLYVSIFGTHRVLELDCSRTKFRELRMIKIATEDPFAVSLYYIPSPYRMLVDKNEIIQATSCDTEKVVWSVEGQISGRQILPRSLLFLPNHNVILVSDGNDNSRILVLDLSTGDHLQTIQPSDNVVDVWDLFSYDCQIMMKHNDIKDTTQISFFSVTA